MGVVRTVASEVNRSQIQALQVILKHRIGTSLLAQFHWTLHFTPGGKG